LINHLGISQIHVSQINLEFRSGPHLHVGRVPPENSWKNVEVEAHPHRVMDDGGSENGVAEQVEGVDHQVEDQGDQEELAKPGG
jgi:hypothetical protein